MRTFGIDGLRRLMRPAFARGGMPAVPEFTTSREYWERRYGQNGDSGPGSYDRLARHKADYLNGLTDRLGIESVVEFGSGDGAQLSLARYPSYVGVDVAPTALALCRDRFEGDRTKRFVLADEFAWDPSSADMTMSLDVIYHLVEDDVFHEHMTTLFACARRAVVIYSSDKDESWPDRHVRHRRFSTWVHDNAPSWTLREKLPNPFPYDPERPRDTSFADFHLFQPC